MINIYLYIREIGFNFQHSLDKVLLTKGCTDPWDPKALRGGAGGQFRIPVRGPMEWSSIESFLPDSQEYSFYIADNNWRQRTSTTDAGDLRDIEHVSELRSLPYTAVSFRNCQHAVLVIGGETEGISREAYQILAHQRRMWTPKANGVEADGDEDAEASVSHGHHALQIPLANGVESLNTSVAASILLFEIRKQMQSK